MNTPVINQDIIDSLTNLCLKQTLAKLIDNNFKDDISNIIGLFNTNDHINVTFNESSIASSVYGQSSILLDTRSFFESTITLNDNVLVGSSQELIATTMIHEVLHSYFDYNHYYYDSGLGQHLKMAEDFVDIFRNSIRTSFPNLTEKDANGLIINGFSEIQTYLPANFQQILDKYQLTLEDIAEIRSRYKKNGTSGIRCPN